MLPSASLSLQLEFPSNAHVSARTVHAMDSFALPVGPWQNGALETRSVEGAIAQTVWQVRASVQTTTQMLRPLREQLIATGYEILFECADKSCGGFDFRFALEVAPEPQMHVNLGDFQYLSAQRQNDDGETEYLGLIVSRSQETGFIQINQITQPEAPAPEVTTTIPDDEPVYGSTNETFGTLLEQRGFVVLDDLDFQTGAARLTNESFASLEGLSDYLSRNPDLKVALVGHTDAVGSLANNINLSKQRANAVLRRLVEEYGVNRTQLDADGVGYLSPRASNLTDEGRAQNRRVEVIITSTR
ncbi:OmpA family protein [Cochlodiniinecator piscidefendens]|uniref:OmpA family protein n=1 Tax=Cochlodiniinecator piscidefendens TaxID=2715756 RepID=UPI001E289E00|nr:OmpA family protein [Cochlodiniinecator piscidefendens]